MQTNGREVTSEDRVLEVIRGNRESWDIFGGRGSLLAKAKKGGKLPEGFKTNQGSSVGIKPHLMNKSMARTLRDYNPTHASCLDAKVGATTGLGHRDATIHEILDPLCRFHWQDTLDAVCSDYWETGEGFLETTWDENRTVVLSLNHVESAQSWVELEEEDNSNDYHFLVSSETSLQVIMANFDDLLDLRERFNIKPVASKKKLGGVLPLNSVEGSGNPNDSPLVTRSRRRLGGASGAVVNSELIHFRQPNNRSRWLGYPDYLSATPSIELAQCMTQQEFDFYFNRAVPEFLLILIGKALSTNSWEKVKEVLNANQGYANSHKTSALHFPGTPQDTAVQIEKLAMEGTVDNGFSDKSAALAMAIATAHGVPPMLANILLPGKIGAANEGPNALMLFQKRKLGQAQRNFSCVLAATLGSGIMFAQPDGKPVTLSREQFLGKAGKPKPNPMDPQSAMGSTDENGMPIFAQVGNGFNTILDGMTLGAQDTLSRMKEPLAGSSRNPEDGLLGGASDRKKTDVKKKPGR